MSHPPGSSQPEQRLHGVVQLDLLATAARDVRKLFRNYGVGIPPDSVLEDYLSECEKFVLGTHDVPTPSTGAALDDLAVHIGNKHLTIYRLFESLRVLLQSKAPKLQERLADLAKKTIGLQEHEEQFMDAEYETFCAAEFNLSGVRVSFIRQKQKSRYIKRVEFLIKHLYPVECKRPRRAGNVVNNVEAATEKIVERSSPGLVFIALDKVLSQHGPYCEVENVLDLTRLLTLQFEDFWQQYKSQILATLRGTPVQAIVFTCTRLAYYHDTGTAALPSFLLALTPDGAMIAQEVIRKCVELLEKNRT